MYKVYEHWLSLNIHFLNNSRNSESVILPSPSLKDQIDWLMTRLKSLFFLNLKCLTTKHCAHPNVIYLDFKLLFLIKIMSIYYLWVSQVAFLSSFSMSASVLTESMFPRLLSSPTVMKPLPSLSMAWNVSEVSKKEKIVLWLNQR